MKWGVFYLIIPAISLALEYGKIVQATNPALPPAYKYREYVFPEPDDDIPCSAAENQTANLGQVTFAQTHVLEPEWPFFFLIANRPALLQVVVTGSGASPQVSVEGYIGVNSSLGILCLDGPSELAQSVDLSTPSLSDRFSITIPRSWMLPGLSLTIRAGKSVKSYSEAELGLGSAPEINLLMFPFDMLDYNEGKEDKLPPETFLPDFAGAMPAAITRLGMFPGRISLDSMIAADGKNDEPVVLYTRRDLKGVPNGNINAAALRFIDALKHGTGDYSYSFFYGNTENFNAGGWGGGKAFVGADYGGVFIHEMGHGLSLPHWGEDYDLANPNPGRYEYPYGGVGDNGGGRGDHWQFYQNIQEFISPICEVPNHQRFGTERSDAMQRSNHCPEIRGDGTGPWDGFGDFSAIAMFRFLTGADNNAGGTIPYRGQNRRYNLKPQAGFPTLKLDNQGNRVLERSHQVMVKQNWETLDFKVPQQWNVPVYTVFGNHHPQYTQANILYQPVASLGNLPRVIDPTDPQTFADLKAGRNGPWGSYFWVPRDIVLKFTYEDNTVLHALYPHGSVSRDWTPGKGPWRFDLLYWALNIPGHKKLSRLEMYHRPFAVRNANTQFDGNIANPAYGITAQNFMDDAVLLKSIEVITGPVSGTDKKAAALGGRKKPWQLISNGIQVKSSGPHTVSVYNLLGKQIFRKKGIGPAYYSLKSIRPGGIPGMYIVRFQNTVIDSGERIVFPY